MRMAAKWLRQGPGAVVPPDAPLILPESAVSVKAGREVGRWGPGTTLGVVPFSFLFIGLF